MMLAVLLAGSVMVPAAMAAEDRIVSNGTTYKTTYVGMKSSWTVYERYGDAMDPEDYRWKSSNKSVATVNSSGVVTAKKTGKTTITATNRYDSSDKTKMVLTVKANKANIRTSKPSASAVSYKGWDVFLKSVNIVSPTRVDVEYYLVCNYPSSWKAVKLKSMKDYIRAYDKSSDSYVTTIVDGYGSTVYNFNPRKGRSVQTIKITYKGSAVFDTNVRLSKYNYYYYPEGVLTRKEYY